MPSPYGGYNYSTPVRPPTVRPPSPYGSINYARPPIPQPQRQQSIAKQVQPPPMEMALNSIDFASEGGVSPQFSPNALANFQPRQEPYAQAPRVDNMNIPGFQNQEMQQQRNPLLDALGIQPLPGDMLYGYGR